jgi:hypothetical protein
MMSSGWMRRSLGGPTLLVAVLSVAAAPGHQSPTEAPQPVVDSRPLWTYDTGG